MIMLSEEDLRVLRDLRNRGFAVCVFNADEMPNSDPFDVESAMCSAGWRQIEHDSQGCSNG